MKCSIIGIGTALPPESVSQDDAMSMSCEVICETEKQKRLLRTLFRKAGVQKRHTVIPCRSGYDWKHDGSEHAGGGPRTSERMAMYQQHASPLALASSQAAIQSAEISPSEITHLVTVSCTGFSAPGVDIDLIRELQLPATTQRVHVGFMGCHGTINGLRVARAQCAAEPAARILLCSVELCSLHYRTRWDDEGIIGNALFADGSAALVVSGQDSQGARLGEVAATGANLVPDSESDMSWLIGDHGFQMRLTSHVPDCIQQHLQPWVLRWLSDNGLTIEQIENWIVHPGGPKIIDAVESSLSLKDGTIQVSRDVLNDCGNMSSATVLFILERITDSIRSGPTVMLAFGPGVMVEAALLMP